MKKDFSSYGFWVLVFSSSLLLAMSSGKQASEETQEEEAIFCTMDVKECSDGSFVARDPSKNCEFKECPKAATEKPNR
jgi:hypothetical protein